MKYKDFKQMSNEDMKQIQGGNAPIGGLDDGSGGCSANSTCTKKVGNTTYIATCSTVQLKTGAVCICSKSSDGYGSCSTV